MKKVVIQNLGMIVTNRCNLDCDHCLRGCKNNKDMTKEVIEATLSQVRYIGNLAICGGEPTLAIETLNNIFEYIINNKIIIDEVTATINGTNYSEEFLMLFDYINDYISCYVQEKQHSNAFFCISYDEYHVGELKRLNIYKKYLENIKKYRESIHYAGILPLDNNLKLFREGNAQKLDESITVKLKPMETFITYVGKKNKFDKNNGVCNIGPLITINPDGIITECDASIEHQNSIFNYGNILNESIEEVALRRGKILKPNNWFRQCLGTTRRYHTYNK